MVASMTKFQAAANHYGQDVSARIEAEPEAVIALDSSLVAVWELAAPLLRVRDNDAHTLYALGLAYSLLESHAEADAAIVIPAIMLHDVGWSEVPPELILQAIAPGGGRPDLVLLHEQEGAKLAKGILAETGYDASKVPEILKIIDGHDSRNTALSIEDAIVKDSDKTWRLSPHRIDTVMDWFGLDRDQALRLCSQRVRTATSLRRKQKSLPGRWPRSNPSTSGHKDVSSQTRTIRRSGCPKTVEMGTLDRS